MTDVIADRQARLVHATALLLRRYELLVRLRELLAPLVTSDLVAVEGERALVGELGDSLARGREALDKMSRSPGSANERQLTTLESCVIGAAWEVAEDLEGRLERSRDDYEARLSDYDKSYQDWRQAADDLKELADSASKAGAVIPEERAQMQRLGDLVRGVDRARDEHRYSEADANLQRLQAEFGEAIRVDLHKRIASKHKHAEILVSQASLHMISAPLDDAKVNYTVLLRTPSISGGNGINIQETTTLVQDDRKAIIDMLADITKAVNGGLTRRHSARQAASRHVGARPQPESDATEPSESLPELIADAGRLMYRLFVPEVMRADVSEKDCSLSITTNDLELPWELMHDDEDFLCLKRPVARMPMGHALPRRPRETARREPYRLLLIYSDPTKNLPEAGAEVRKIKEALEERRSSVVEIQLVESDAASGRELNRLIGFDSFDIIHYAGHAAFDESKPDLSGLLMNDSVPFFAQKIRRLLTGRPLVFLNACETGRTANEAPQTVGRYLGAPAEGLTSAFVYGGAMACIGAQWPVFDDSAAEFALTFYESMLAGNFVGEALRRARQETKERFPDEISWASFVLYGDPTFRLGGDRASMSVAGP